MCWRALRMHRRALSHKIPLQDEDQRGLAYRRDADAWSRVQGCREDILSTVRDYAETSAWHQTHVNGLRRRVGCQGTRCKHIRSTILAWDHACEHD
jgi:hypothetical protein